MLVVLERFVMVELQKSFSPVAPGLLYTQAVRINPAPTTELIPICSPMTATAKAVPQSGSVENMSVVSAAERLSKARVSI